MFEKVQQWHSRRSHLCFKQTSLRVRVPHVQVWWMQVGLMNKCHFQSLSNHYLASLPSTGNCAVGCIRFVQPTAWTFRILCAIKMERFTQTNVSCTIATVASKFLKGQSFSVWEAIEVCPSKYLFKKYIFSIVFLRVSSPRQVPGTMLRTL